MTLNAKIKVEVINDDFEYENWGLNDLSDPDTYYEFLLAFGNGLLEEIRVVAETKGGIFAFTNLIERGGYQRGQASEVKNAKLYQAGDVCYPQNAPFIFISPNAEDGERVNFDNYPDELEDFLQSAEFDNTDKPNIED